MTTTEYVDTAQVRQSSAGTSRLRLKPARSTRLADALPSLLEAFARHSGVIDRFRDHQSDWSPATSSLEYQGGAMSLDPSDTYTAMTTTASADDVSTPDQLLGHTERRAKDRRNALIALQRWESEGGALRGPR